MKNQTENYKPVLIVDLLIKQSNENIWTSLLQKNYFLKCCKQSAFRKLDASTGYWQIKIDGESSNLLTFRTTIGRFCFKWLLYGKYSTSEVSSTISDIQVSANSQDDIVIWRKTIAEHDNCLQKVLLKARESGLKLNKNEFHFRKSSTIFWYM